LISITFDSLKRQPLAASKRILSYKQQIIMDSLLEPEDQLREKYLSPPWGDHGRSFTLGTVSLFSKFLLHVLNTTNVDNLPKFHDHVLNRPENIGLITVSNHTSTIDDPMLFCAMLPLSFFFTEHEHGKVRWALCARELCYRNQLLGQFFQSGKTLPIERGKGPLQPVMKVTAGELSRGGWVHLFPEGRINYTGQLGHLRWGIGKVFCDAVEATGSVPRVLPFYHSGMGRVMPRRARVPRVGNDIDVIVGDTINMDDLAARCGKEREDQKCVWKDIASRVAEALRELEKRAPRPNIDQVPGREEVEMQRHSEGALPEAVGGE
jgi:monolysocardiolipin acyltransferase